MNNEYSKEQRQTLLQLARATLNHRLQGGDEPLQPADPLFQNKRAVFVTLTLKGKLRGCIGSLVAVAPLWQNVHDNALNAAFHDHRFESLTQEELSLLKIEISVLSPPQSLTHSGGADLVGKLKPGVDGVILRKSGRSATFLPQVWEQLKTPETFLNHLCTKAGLPKNSWLDDDVFIETYQVECFSESEL